MKSMIPDTSLNIISRRLRLYLITEASVNYLNRKQII
jgi:hypothetical protein